MTSSECHLIAFEINGSEWVVPPEIADPLFSSGSWTLSFWVNMKTTDAPSNGSWPQTLQGQPTHTLSKQGGVPMVYKISTAHQTVDPSSTGISNPLKRHTRSYVASYYPFDYDGIKTNASPSGVSNRLTQYLQNSPAILYKGTSQNGTFHLKYNYRDFTKTVHQSNLFVSENQIISKQLSTNQQRQIYSNQNYNYIYNQPHNSYFNLFKPTMLTWVQNKGKLTFYINAVPVISQKMDSLGFNSSFLPGRGPLIFNGKTYMFKAVKLCGKAHSEESVRNMYNREKTIPMFKL